ncbi:hypothetical protein [Ewingella americana]|uniref:5'-3' exonuclease domain-containing protein n=1 Tax=Ewingella americana TaxID=41202 RepID=A0A502GH01_9GAMM|nr:hypothetical protein [Ewingella americana]TPG60003.1 hypothetical protein EAH77_15665 [Ewingella americana]
MLFGSRILCIDMGSLTAQSYAAVNVKGADGSATPYSAATSNRAAYLFFQSMLGLSTEHGAPVMVHDKFPTRKLNQYPGYKESRFQRYKDAIENLNLIDPELGKHEAPPNAELSTYQQFRQHLVPILKTLPSMHAYAYGEEADDTVFTLACSLGKVSKVKPSVYSRDTDMMQICAIPGCRLILKKGSAPAHVVQDYEIGTQYGVRADQVALYKAFLGDYGDSIPGMPRFHTKYVISDIIGDRTTVDQVYDAWDAGEIAYDHWHKGWYEYFEHHLGYALAEDLAPDGSYIQTIERGKGQAFINEKLARLDPDCNAIYEYHSGDYVKFEELYMNLAGKMAHNLPPVEIWNKMVRYAEIIINTFQKDGIPISVAD